MHTADASRKFSLGKVVFHCIAQRSGFTITLYLRSGTREPTLSASTIAVYGAGGHTGKFVVRELQRRSCTVASIGRNPASSNGTGTAPRDWRVASCDQPDLLDEALRGCSAVINCAGPFLDTAPALIEAALRARIHYFDVAAEQRSVRQSLATYREEARERGVVVLPAMAFYGGLGDLLAADASRRIGSVDSIEIGVALDYWHPTSGTRQTGERNTARRLIVAEGRLVPLPQAPQPRAWTFPEPFGTQEMAMVPLSEIVLIHRHLAARTVSSYLNLVPLRDLGDPSSPPPSASDASGRSSQRFVMDVRASSGEVQCRTTASGFDIYAVTAPIVAEACLRVLNDPPDRGGTYAPAELFEPEEFLAALAPDLQIARRPDVCARALGAATNSESTL